MKEGLHLHARNRRRLPDLLERHLAGERHSGEPQVAQGLHRRAPVGRKLGRGVQLELLEVAARHPQDPQVLHDERVRAELGERPQGLRQGEELLLQDERVHRHEDPASRGEGAGVAEELVELLEGEVLGVGAGRVALQPQVDRVGPVPEGGEPRLQAARGREQLHPAGATFVIERFGGGHHGSKKEPGLSTPGRTSIIHRRAGKARLHGRRGAPRATSLKRYPRALLPRRRPRARLFFWERAYARRSRQPEERSDWPPSKTWPAWRASPLPPSPASCPARRGWTRVPASGSRRPSSPPATAPTSSPAACAPRAETCWAWWSPRSCTRPSPPSSSAPSDSASSTASTSWSGTPEASRTSRRPSSTTFCGATLTGSSSPGSPTAAAPSTRWRSGTSPR